MHQPNYPYTRSDYDLTEDVPTKESFVEQTLKTTSAVQLSDQLIFIYVTQGHAKLQINQHFADICQFQLAIILPQRSFQLQPIGKIEFYQFQFSLTDLILPAQQQHNFFALLQLQDQFPEIISFKQTQQSLLANLTNYLKFESQASSTILLPFLIYACQPLFKNWQSTRL